MKKVFTVALLIFLLTVAFCAFICCSAEDDLLTPKDEFTFDGKSLAEFANMDNIPDINGYAAYAVNLNTGSLIYEKNCDSKVYPTSTTKLMTAIVAYENIEDLDMEIALSNYAYMNASGSHMGLRAGEVLTARQLLYGVLLRGANEASLQLAIEVAGSEEEFCKLMNKKAKELGCSATTFANVTGFHDEGSVTTARDVAIIAKYFYYNTELFDMSNTKSYVVERTEKCQLHTLSTRNLLIANFNNGQPVYLYDGARGMNVGGTPEGGNCLVSTVTGKDNQTYLCVVMNAPDKNGVNTGYLDMTALFDFCLENFSYQSVASSQDVVCQIDVKNASDIDELALFPKEEIKMLLPNNIEFSKDIKIEKRLTKSIASAPVNKGEAFGEIVVKYKDKVALGRTQLVSNVVIDRSNILYVFSRIERIVMSKGFIVFAVTALVLFGAYIGVSVYYHYFRKNKYTGNTVNRRKRQ